MVLKVLDSFVSPGMSTSPRAGSPHGPEPMDGIERVSLIEAKEAAEKTASHALAELASLKDDLLAEKTARLEEKSAANDLHQQLNDTMRELQQLQGLFLVSKARDMQSSLLFLGAQCTARYDAGMSLHGGTVPSVEPLRLFLDAPRGKINAMKAAAFVTGN